LISKFSGGQSVSGAMKKAVDNWEKLRPPVDTIRGQAFGLGYVVRFLSACIRLACGRSRSSTDDNAKAEWLMQDFQERKINWYRRLLNESTLAQEDA
jgi:hypothetical protein